MHRRVEARAHSFYPFTPAVGHALKTARNVATKLVKLLGDADALIAKKCSPPSPAARIRERMEEWKRKRALPTL
jgi:hypothetical protein